MKTSFDGRMSETDAANMRGNMQELQFFLGTVSAILTMGLAFDSDDKKNFRINSFIINKYQANCKHLTKNK